MKGATFYENSEHIYRPKNFGSWGASFALSYGRPWPNENIALAITAITLK